MNMHITLKLLQKVNIAIANNTNKQQHFFPKKWPWEKTASALDGNLYL